MVGPGAPFPVTPQPSLGGFESWVYAVMGVPQVYLPSGSEWTFYAYNTAAATVHPFFQRIPGPIYLQCLYNLAAHLLVTWAPDVMTTPPYPYITLDNVPYGYFAYLRKQNNVLGYTTGTVTASSDESTSVTLTVPEQMSNLTIGQLQLTTTPWGRAYLGMAQDVGTNWGIS